MNWFNSLSFQWKIILVVVIIFLLWLAWRKFGYKFQQLTQARDIQLLPGETPNLTPEEQGNAKDIAQKIYNDIEDTPVTGHDYEGYESALKLTDKELNFLADYYKKYLSGGRSLYSDIDSQYYITSGEPAKLMVRLAAIGKR